ncbi:hypothetical protein TRIATDRAFT_274363 [Trichoderma atroviride IMI 206040]|uniref:Uncharacterized protein n=1 Tax=Hypocrea atroviridis (strain ATCC 20476 / IMI 206040) TaxID=452589 RepID=G9NUZ1_HYPAI|nr:uncharacterized protein TRIATDRAFT_274363 [Trichoderma atroviride IMI 206040]EHK44815.1 hypothetical protein TRIATDRAFT_274363 [Trichoderma atroviride IMI 206040]
MSQRIFFSAFLILWLASRASADGGDDFASNLASDLGPIIALFGERVVMQFMSQAMGIADCILLAVAPIGAITTVVSAIRVAGPAWLKSFIGRARENLAAAEVEVMSSTSTETCELWNGNSVVRCPGSADIYQFICLIPKNKANEDLKSFDVGCTKLRAGVQQKTEKKNSGNAEELQSDGQATEQVQEETRWFIKTKRTGPPYIRRGFRKCISLASKKWKLVSPFPSHAIQNTEEDLDKDLEKNASNMGSPTKHSKRSSPTASTSSQSMEGMEIIVLEDVDGSAPNLLLNCHERVGRSAIYLAATIGLILQLGAVIYFGVITYHKPTKNTFLKDGRRVVKYAFPCAAVGTLLLVLGLFICSWVVTESTDEIYYEAKNHQIYVVWLQKDHTVSDQVFKPFAVYPTSKREYVTLSRRNIKHRPNEFRDLFLIIMNKLFKDSRPVEMLNHYYQGKLKMGEKNGDYMKGILDQPLYWPLKFITFIGALISLIGFISQFIGMRGLNWTASIVQLGITIVVTILRVIVRRGLGKPPAHTSLNPKFELDWFVLSLRDGDTAPWAKADHNSRASGNRNNDPQDEMSSKWEICPGGELTYHEDDNEPIKASEPHKIMQIRKRLGKLSKWKSPIQEEATHLSRALEAVANTFLRGQSKVKTVANTGSSGQSNTEAVSNTGLSAKPKENYKWSIPAIYTANHLEGPVEGHIHIIIYKDEQHGWQVDEAEIEAILSLWLYSSSPTDHHKDSRPRHLRVYGPSKTEKRLNRDLEWWMPENIPQNFKYTKDEITILTQKGSERTVVGFKIEHGSAKLPTKTPTKKYFVLECQDNQQRLFSRELFFSFMRALAKLPEIDTSSASSEHPLSSSTITKEWNHMRLKNNTISNLAKRLEKIGFGSLSDIYIDLIMPLSLEHKLTDVKNIIDGVSKEAREYERSLQWEKLVDTCICLLDLALRFDLQKESSSPRAIAICLGFLYRLHHEAKLQKSERRTEEELTKQLKRLRRRFFKDHLGNIAYFPAVLKDKYKGFAMSLSTLAGPNNNSPKSFPDSFQIAAENLNTIREIKSEKKPPIPDIKAFEKTDAFGWSLLHYAAPLTLDIYDNNWETSDSFIFLNSRDLMDWTLLHHACFFGNETMVNMLLKYRAQIEIAGKDGITPMHCAVQSGKAKILQILVDVLEKRRKTNTRKSEHYVDHNERHPIHWAAVKGNVEMVRIMEDDISQSDRFGWTPLHLAAIYEHEKLLRHISEDHTEVINATDNELRTPLRLAVEYELVDAVKILLQAGAKVNTTAKDGLTPFHVALKQKEKQILQIFLQHGANMDVLDTEGRTPLYQSVEDDEIETIKMLIDKGANVKIARKDGRTPLHVALSRRQDGLEVAKILLQAGADVNTEAEDGATQPEIAQALLDKGANTTILNFRGFSPLQQALYSEDLTTARKLIEHDKRSTTKAVLQKSERGDTPLHTLAASNWQEDTKCNLLEGLLSISPEIDINAKNDRGQTPLDFALSGASGLFIDKLLEIDAKPGSTFTDRLFIRRLEEQVL